MCISNKLSYNGKPLIWPFPNHCEWREGSFNIGERTTISCPAEVKGEIELLRNRLPSSVFIAENANADIQVILSADDAVNPEGYVLKVDNKKIALKACTKKGIFYGVHTLLQLISNSAGDAIPAVFISDLPHKAYRGVHIYLPPREGFAWFKRYVDFLAKYRYNAMILEVGAAMEYQSHPEINRAWKDFCGKVQNSRVGDEAMYAGAGWPKNSCHTENAAGEILSKEEVAKLIDYISQKHIRIIPEMESLSHSYWLLLAHPEFAERPEDPYPDTYCPSSPGIYDIYFDCLQEVIDLFKPDAVHIGHDEYYHIGLCGECRGKSGQELLAGDITKIHDWLAQRSIKTIMWGDKLFDYIDANGNPQGGRERTYTNKITGGVETIVETYKAADMIPKDILVMDWYHSINGEDTKSQDYFVRKGFQVIFGNFDDIRGQKYGIPHLEERLERPNVLGVSCSLWHEVSDKGMTVKDALVYYLEASNIGWYKGYDGKKHYKYNDLISQIYPLERESLNNTVPVSFESDSFEFADISDACNTALKSDIDCSFINSADPLPNTIPFKVCKNVKNALEDAAFILAGQKHGRVKINFNSGGQFKALAFLHAYTLYLKHCPVDDYTYFDHSGFIIGYYAVEYNDGTSVKIPVEYASNITCINNEFEAYCANPVYREVLFDDQAAAAATAQELRKHAIPYAAFSYEWRNPYPDKLISGIFIEHNGDKEGDIMLFGITGIK